MTTATDDGALLAERTVLDALCAGVIMLDPDDRLALANPAARGMGLIRRTEDGGERLHSRVARLVRLVRAGGTPRIQEFDIPREQGAGPRGEPLAVQVRVVSLPDGYIAVEVSDITESHRLARVRRDFVGNVSHELKTPVGALRLLSEALTEALGDALGSRANEPDAAAVIRFAERIDHESARLARLVAELLELSRLQGAEPLPEPAAVAVDRVVTEVIDRTRTPSGIKQISVEAGGDRGLTVYGNESQLVTAVANLVENAVTYSPEGTRVLIETRLDDEMIEVSVADEGIGIEPENLDRIFERFYRADRARSRSTGGTGLGLAIVKHIATNHGGAVEVTSTVGVGSTFTLRLPARPRDVVAASSTPGQIGGGTLAGGGKSAG